MHLEHTTLMNGPGLFKVRTFVNLWIVTAVYMMTVKAVSTVNEDSHSRIHK